MRWWFPFEKLSKPLARVSEVPEDPRGAAGNQHRNRSLAGQ
jgi:hypothetical protein